MRGIFRTLLLMGAATFTTTLLHGQQPAIAASHVETDLALTYSVQRSNQTNGASFWQQGGALDLSAQFYHGWGIAMNVAGERASNINNSNVNLTMVATTFGPRYTWSLPSRKLTVFGQGLIGEAFGSDSIFPTPRGAQTDTTSFALQVGGGVDLRLSKHLAVRLLQADWLRTQFPNASTNVQNNLRLGAGIVFRFPR